MAQARSGSKVRSKINALVYGAPFSGKSTYGVSMAKLKTEDGRPYRLLVLDCEMSSVDEYMEQLENEGVKLDNIYIVYTQSLEEVNQYVKIASARGTYHQLDENGEETDQVVLDADGNPFVADAILLDGSSILKMACQQSLLKLSQKRARIKANKNGLVGEAKAVAIEGASLEIKDWGSLKYSGQSLILNLAASNLSWVVTAREKVETESVRGKDGSIESVSTGNIVPDGFGGADYNCKSVMRFFRDEDDPDLVKMQVIKDRTGLYAAGQIVENPSVLDFQPLLNRGDRKELALKNTMEQAVEIETKMYQKQAGITDDDPDEEVSTADTNAKNAVKPVQKAQDVQDVQSNPAEPKATPVAAVTETADELRDQIKYSHNIMNPVQRKAFTTALKAKNLPTNLKATDDVAVLNQVLSIAFDTIEGKAK